MMVKMSVNHFSTQSGIPFYQWSLHLHSKNVTSLKLLLMKKSRFYTIANYIPCSLIRFSDSLLKHKLKFMVTGKVSGKIIPSTDSNSVHSTFFVNYIMHIRSS